MIILHADDFGITDEVTDKILHCIDHGYLKSASIICNTEGFKYAISRYRNIREMRLCLHLNLIEGKPVSNREKVTAIINDKGEFKYSFLSLWLHYLISGKRKKKTIRYQIKQEIVRYKSIKNLTSEK